MFLCIHERLTDPLSLAAFKIVLLFLLIVGDETVINYCQPANVADAIGRDAGDSWLDHVRGTYQLIKPILFAR